MEDVWRHVLRWLEPTELLDACRIARWARQNVQCEVVCNWREECNCLLGHIADQLAVQLGQGASLSSRDWMRFYAAVRLFHHRLHQIANPSLAHPIDNNQNLAHVFRKRTEISIPESVKKISSEIFIVSGGGGVVWVGNSEGGLWMKRAGEGGEFLMVSSSASYASNEVYDSVPTAKHIWSFTKNGLEIKSLEGCPDAPTIPLSNKEHIKQVEDITASCSQEEKQNAQLFYEAACVKVFLLMGRFVFAFDAENLKLVFTREYQEEERTSASEFREKLAARWDIGRRFLVYQPFTKVIEVFKTRDGESLGRIKSRVDFIFADFSELDGKPIVATLDASGFIGVYVYDYGCATFDPATGSCSCAQPETNNHNTSHLRNFYAFNDDFSPTSSSLANDYPLLFRFRCAGQSLILAEPKFLPLGIRRRHADDLNGCGEPGLSWHLVHGIADDAAPPSLEVIEVKVEGAAIVALAHQDSQGNLVFLLPDFRKSDIFHCRPKQAGLMHSEVDRVEFRHNSFIEIGSAADPIWLANVGGSANFAWLNIKNLEPMLRLPNCVGEFRTDARETMLQFEVPPIGAFPMMQGPVGQWSGKIIVWQGFGFFPD